MKCETCEGTGRIVLGKPGWPLDDPICDTCGGTGEAASKTWRGRPLYTQEDLAAMPCPLPPEPDAGEEKPE